MLGGALPSIMCDYFSFTNIPKRAWTFRIYTSEVISEYYLILKFLPRVFLSKFSKVIPLSNVAVYSFKEHHETAIKLREGFLPTAKEFMTDHPSVGTLYEELGSSYEALGDAKKSMECRKEAIRIFEGFLGDHKFTATSYLGLGTTLKSQGRISI